MPLRDDYKAAMSFRERRTHQVAGPSVDRRTCEYTLQLYNGEMVRSLKRGCCVCIKVDTGHLRTDIEFKTGKRFVKLEETNPGI